VRCRREVVGYALKTWRLTPLQLVEPTLLDQCFSTGVPRNLRVSRVAARVPPKQTKFAWDGIRLLHIVGQTLGSLYRVPWATPTFAEGSAAAKRLKTTALDYWLPGRESEKLLQIANQMGTVAVAPSCSCVIRINCAHFLFPRRFEIFIKLVRSALLVLRFIYRRQQY